MLIGGLTNHDVQLWHLDSGTLAATLSGHNTGIQSVAFGTRRTRHLLASFSKDYMILIWNVSTSELVANYSEVVELFQYDPNVALRKQDLAFDPSGDRLAAATGSIDIGMVFIWQIQTNELVHSWPFLARVDTVRWHPTGMNH